MTTHIGMAGARTSPAAPLSERVAPGARTVVIAASKDDNPKVTLLLVPPGAARPTIAVKVATTDGAADSVRHEAEVLGGLDRNGLGTAAPTVPRLIDLIDHEGRPAMVTDALPGAPMSIAYHSWRHTARSALVQRDFGLAQGWLDSMSLTGGAVAPWPGEPWSTRLTQRWPSDPELVDLLEPLRALEAEVASNSLPGAIVHGDFWCGNILTTKAGVSGVVDWEAAEASGNPLRDWARFALSYSLYLDRHTRRGRSVAGHGTLRAHRWGDGLRWALTGNGWYPDVVRSFLIQAVQRLDLPAARWRHTALLGLAEIAVVADHETFARQHLEVLVELLRTPGVVA
jgi:hypothetical protein